MKEQAISIVENNEMTSKKAYEYKWIFIQKKFIDDNDDTFLIVETPDMYGKKIKEIKHFDRIKKIKIKKAWGRETDDGKGWIVKIRTDWKFDGFELVRTEINSNEWVNCFLHLKEEK
jgi:hypothetical protein